MLTVVALVVVECPLPVMSGNMYSLTNSKTFGSGSVRTKASDAEMCGGRRPGQATFRGSDKHALRTKKNVHIGSTKDLRTYLEVMPFSRG